MGCGRPNLCLSYLKWAREEYFGHWADNSSHQYWDTFSLIRDFNWALVLSDIRICRMGGRPYLIVRLLTWVHQDHVGRGSDLRIYMACLNEAWDAPRQFIWDIKEN